MKILRDNRKFFGSYRNVPWYIEDKNEAEELASKLGFKSFRGERSCSKKNKQFCRWGGFMFAMCSATDFDIALAADGVDICEPMFDGDPSDANYQSSMNYVNFCFQRLYFRT
jgi:hypothetical protein